MTVREGLRKTAVRRNTVRENSDQQNSSLIKSKSNTVQKSSAYMSVSIAGKRKKKKTPKTKKKASRKTRF